MTLISLSGIDVEFGATTLFRDVVLTVGEGDRWGIVGRNGSGKTTLFRLITGALAPTRGTIARAPAMRIAMLDQHRDFGDATTVWEAAARPYAPLIALERDLTDQAARLAELGEGADPRLLDRFGHDQERFAHEGGYTFHARVDAVLQGLGFDADTAKGQLLKTLSGGERGRVGLAAQLVAPADLLLLDEPTNHLDLETTDWLQQYLRDVGETVLVISHDRAFLDAVADHVLHLEGGTATTYRGGYSSFVVQRTERRLTLDRQVTQQRKVIAKEEDYIRRNIAGQNTAQAKGRRKRLDRLPRLSPPPGESETMVLRLEAAERGGDRVVSAEHLRVTVPTTRAGAGAAGADRDGGDDGDGDRGGEAPRTVDSGGAPDRLLVDDFTATAHRGDVIALVGPNGAGKSTLLQTLLGERTPAAGAAKLGGSITAAWYRQDLAQVPLDTAIYDVIATLRPLWTRGHIQGHLGCFGFSGDEVLRSTTTLSGGERSRVALAMIMLERANLLVLDEPTNHLDVESIEVLEDAIDEYDGTVLLVSHDRAFLRELTTRVWAFDGTRLADFPGSFVEWEAAQAARATRHAAREAEEAAARRDRDKARAKQNAASQEREHGARRAAKRAAADAEQAVAALEKQVAELRKALDDPELYDGTAEGAKRAAKLDRDLTKAQRALDDAVARWVEMAD